MGVYIYSMNITRENYYLKSYDKDGAHVDYVFIEASGNRNIRYLGGNGQLLFRRFEGDKQYAMSAFDSSGMLRYFDDDADIMFEYVGDGSFICR